MKAKMTKGHPLKFVAEFANAKLTEFDPDEWKALHRDFESFFEVGWGPNGWIENATGIILMARNGGRPGNQMTKDDFKKLQSKLRDILRLGAWTKSTLQQLRKDPRRLEQVRKSKLKKWKRYGPAIARSSVEVQFSGTLSVRAGRMLTVAGPSEETFLLTVLFIIARAERLPFGTCLECDKLFQRVGRQIYCDKQCTWRASQRAKRGGFSRPRTNASGRKQRMRPTRVRKK